MMDRVGNKAARKEIAMIKVAALNVATRVIDRAIQAHGAGGCLPGLRPGARLRIEPRAAASATGRTRSTATRSRSSELRGQ